MTDLGSRPLTDNKLLFETIFKGYCTKYNWTYLDSYEDDDKGVIGQAIFAYSLLLVSKYGGVKRRQSFYAERYFKVTNLELNPDYNNSDEIFKFACYTLRTFDHFLYAFGLVILGCEMPKDPSELVRIQLGNIVKTPLFDKLIKFRPHKH